MPYFDDEIKNDAGNPIPVSATALPLPAGAATSAKQDAAKAVLDTIYSAVDGVEALLTSISNNTDTLEVSIGNVDVNTDELESRIGDLTATPVATSLLGRVKDMQTKLASIDGKDFASQTTLAAAKTVLDNILSAVDNLEGYTDGIEAKLDILHADLATGATVDVTDRVGRLLGHVTVDGSALPTGASTAAKQDLTNTKLDTLHADLAGGISVSVSSEVEVKNDSGNPVPVTVATMPLPAGAATSAKQDTGNTSLSNIDGKTPALGQGAMAASTPVVIASNQSAVPVSGPLTDAQLRTLPVPVSNASLPLPTGAATSAAQVTGNASLASIDSKLANPLPVTGPLTDAQLRAAAVPVSNASLPLPAGASTAAAQATAGASLSSIDGKTPALGQAAMAASQPVVIASNQSAVPVSGPLTDTQLRATSVPVSGPLTDAQLRAVAVPVSNASLPLPAGAATSAKQPTLGTAGTPSADVISVQGIAGGTAQLVSSIDGGLVTVGTTTDAEAAGNGSLVALLKRLRTLLSAGLPAALGGAGGLKSELVAALPAGTNTVGSVSLVPITSGGVSIYKNIDVNATGQVVKGSAGQVYTIAVQNSFSAERYLKLYNKATAPVVGTDVPVMTIMIPRLANSGQVNVEIPQGAAFSNGIGVAATTAVADNDTGNPSANNVILSLFYK